jgi:hypothetical protein
MLNLLAALALLISLGIGAAAALAIAAAWRKHWKAAFKRAAIAVIGLPIAYLAIGALSLTHLMHTTNGPQLPPPEKARLLAETISTLMNCGALGLLLGLATGTALALRRRNP